jgi:hypothetical protein
VNQLSLGVMARSRKENERRLPIHPQHFGRFPMTSGGASPSNVAARLDRHIRAFAGRRSP